MNKYLHNSHKYPIKNLTGSFLFEQIMELADRDPLTDMGRLDSWVTQKWQNRCKL